MTVVDAYSELRLAIVRLREAAGKATPGPWTAEHPSWAGENAVLSTALNGHAVAVCGEETKGAYHPASADAAWIALVDPLLAGPLAALLGWAGEQVRMNEHRAPRHRVNVDQAVAVARAVNGRQP